MTFSKGKVERGGIGYVRQNFWPLRQFADLSDVNRHAREWLDEFANQRLHRETRQRPCDHFRPDCLRCLPALTPDYRDTAEALVQKDLRLQFDGNRYCAPPHLVAQCLTVKADASSVTLYHRNHCFDCSLLLPRISCQTFFKLRHYQSPCPPSALPPAREMGVSLDRVSLDRPKTWLGGVYSSGIVKWKSLLERKTGLARWTKALLADDEVASGELAVVVGGNL
jgi:hypothetical protein